MTELRVCIGSACHLNGARNVIASFRHMIEEHDLKFFEETVMPKVK